MNSVQKEGETNVDMVEILPKNQQRVGMLHRIP